jgi:hypothetical protein
LTGDQRHRNNTTNGQRVSRYPLPTLQYFLFYSQIVFFNGVRECLSISPPHIVFNSNKRSDSRAPLKKKLNKRVILCQPVPKAFGSTLAFALPIAIGTQANPSDKCQRALSANAPTEHSDNKTEFLRILTNYNF